MDSNFAAKHSGANHKQLAPGLGLQGFLPVLNGEQKGAAWTQPISIPPLGRERHLFVAFSDRQLLADCCKPLHSQNPDVILSDVIGLRGRLNSVEIPHVPHRHRGQPL